MPSAFLDVSYGWMISIGDRTRICENVRILVHDASPQLALHYGRVGLVTIGRDCVISERTVVLPGVTIGDGSIIGAGSVVAHDVPPNSRAMGVPARRYGSADEWLEENRREIEKLPRFGYQELQELSADRRQRVIELLRAAGNRGFHFDPFSATPYYATPPDGAPPPRAVDGVLPVGLARGARGIGDGDAVGPPVER
ncbi:MAG: hypothetical protein HYY06_22315 [Deltaproteobacteria bacterium]|nr:hypothetical protein [Deltaproteobacteria bacterium]